MENKNSMNIIRRTTAGAGKLLSLIAFAIIVLGCATPAHADSISIDLDATYVTLQRSGNLYKHNSSVRVHNSNDYGFTLNLYTDQPDLVNNRDSTYKINSVTGYYKYLSANQWGYGMGSDATSFNPVSNATLADVTKDNNGDCYSISDCTIKLTFGANIDPKRLPVGSYSTSLTYTATSKPAPYVPPAPAPDPEPSTPSGGGGSSSHSNLYYLCEGKYPGSSDMEKWNYCFDHGGDMSGYWDEKCRKEYPDDSGKESYCASHDGDVSGYQPTDWSVVCAGRYPGLSSEAINKWEYCKSHQGDMSGYSGGGGDEGGSESGGGGGVGYDCSFVSPFKESYCIDHSGDMSGYEEALMSACSAQFYEGNGECNWSRCVETDNNLTHVKDCGVISGNPSN